MAFITGTNGDDILSGTPQSDLVDLRAGNDFFLPATATTLSWAALATTPSAATAAMMTSTVRAATISSSAAAVTTGSMVAAAMTRFPCE